MKIIIILAVTLIVFFAAFNLGYFYKDIKRKKPKSEIEKLLSDYREFLNYDGSIKGEKEWKK